MRTLVTQYRGLPRPIYILFVSKIVDAAGFFVAPLLTLVLTDKIGLDGARAGLVIGGMTALAAPALLLGGKIADLIGRKPAILMFTGVTIATYAACAFLPPSLPMLILLTLGITFLSASSPAHDALVADLTAPEQRQTAYGLLYLGWNIGFAVGPAIGGYLLERHLGIMFLGDAATALAALLVVMFFVPEPRRERRLPDRAASPQTTATPEPAAEKSSILSVILARPVLLILSLVLLGYSFVYSQWGFLLPIDLSHRFGESGAKMFGLLAGLNGLTVMICNPVLTLLFRRFPHPRAIFTGGLLYAVGFGLFAVAASVPVFFLLGFVFTLGEICNAISTMPFVMARTPASHRGRMSGVMQVMMGSGSTIGPILAGSALAVVPIGLVWAGMGAIALAFSLLVLLFVDTPRGRA